MDNFDPAAFVQQNQPMAAPSAPSPGDMPGFDPEQFVKDTSAEKYGTTGQQIKAGLEGAAEGVLGPLAPAAERLAGVKPEDIRGRAEENSFTKGLAKAGTLAASLLAGTGEAALIGKAGEAAASAVGLGKVGEAAAALKAARASGDLGEIAAAKAMAAGIPASEKIGAEAVNQAAQMAAFQGGDEISKMILNDPNTSAETAIAHMGLASAMGGVTGAAIGSISPLWKATIGNKVSPMLEDMKGRFNFRLNNPDLPEAVGKELQDLHTNVSESIQKLYSEGVEGGGVRADQIAKAMPEMTEQTTAKIGEQLQKVSDKVSNTLKSMENDIKVKSKVPYLRQDLENFQDIAANPDASYIDKFNALDGLKKTMQGYSRYGSSVDDTAFGAITKKLAAEIRPTLEDSAIWGKAGAVQKDLNKAISEFIPTQSDIMSKFTSKLAGEKVIDPAKVNTYLNQLGKPNAELKQEMMKNYLDKSDKLISTVNDIFAKQGLDSPFKHTSTSVLRNTLGEQTAGAKIVDTLIDKQLAKIVGNTAGGTIGGAIGATLGHPGIGILAGEHALGPLFASVLPGLNKPILDNPSSVNGLKSAIDYGMAVAKGEKALNKSVSSVFKSGAQVLSSSQMPTEARRAALDTMVARMQQQPLKVAQADNGHLGDYLPGHQTSLTKASFQSAQYLASLKPKDVQPSPLDRPIKPTQAQIARYDRALDIAQNPDSVLQHVKDGTLQATDIKDLNSMYPAYYQSMAKKLTDAMMTRTANDEPIPYKTRVSISLFLGQPLDTSMAPTSILAAQPAPQQQPNQGQKPPKKGTSDKAASTMAKTNKMYRTTSQTAEQDRSGRD